MHVLIIEDEFLIALTLEEMLRDLGYTSFDWAVSEEQALEMLRLRRPDLITADIRLGTSNGLAAVTAIHAEADVPAIFVTANDNDVADIEGAIVLSKPVRFEELRAACERVRSGRWSFIGRPSRTAVHPRARERNVE